MNYSTPSENKMFREEIKTYELIEQFLHEKCIKNPKASWRCDDIYQAFEKFYQEWNADSENKTNNQRKVIFFIFLKRVTGFRTIRSQKDRSYYIAGVEPREKTDNIRMGDFDVDEAHPEFGINTSTQELINKFIHDCCNEEKDTYWACASVYKTFEMWLKDEKGYAEPLFSGKRKVTFFTLLYRLTWTHRTRQRAHGKRLYYVAGLEPRGKWRHGVYYERGAVGKTRVFSEGSKDNGDITIQQ